jgi:hypothetical protein
MTCQKSVFHETASSRTSESVAFGSAAALFLVLTVAMFFDVLLFNHSQVLSNVRTDLFQQFIPWREFGFGELKKGHLALWNPYIFCGTPFLGGFQSALFYPFNLLFVCLPLIHAINYSIALHVWLAGNFMYLWARYRKLHWLACVFSGALFMFCGAHFLHIYQGHLANLCTMIWIPIILLCIDGWLLSSKPFWCLAGMAAMAFQILAGQPQYVFYTAIAAGLYAALCLINTQRRLLAASGLAIMWVGAAALTAVQLLTGFQAAGETLRSTGLSYEFASMFSFPPENLLTFLVPGFFGDMVHQNYWGRCYLWEMSLFVGITGLILAIYAFVRTEPSRRRFAGTMIVILLVLALGRHTPLFSLLYHFIYGFDKFRSISKFGIEASAFLILLAGFGADSLLREPHCARRIAWFAGGAAILFILSGLFIKLSAGSLGLWQQLIHSALATGESYLSPSAYADTAFVAQAVSFSSNSCLIAAATLLVLTLVFAVVHKSRLWSYAVIFVGVSEILIFARISRDTFDISTAFLPEIRPFLENNLGDHRYLYVSNPNAGMTIRAPDLWGYDSVVERRYAEFMTFTQGNDPSQATQYVNFTHVDPLYKMLGCSYAFVSNEKGLETTELHEAMPRLNLFQRYRVVRDRDDIFRTMHSSDFEFQNEVILETEPFPKPSPARTVGEIKTVRSTTDDMNLEVTLSDPALLFISNAYSSGWHAKALDGSVQQHYDLLPANYALQAIPLQAGHHHLQVYYRPISFVIGKWISLASLFAFILATAAVLRTRGVASSVLGT